MMERFLGALHHVAEEQPSVGRVVNAFGKHLRRHPMPDEELKDALLWARSMIDGVMTEPEPTVIDVESEPEPVA